jgi:uncharacterized RmlC-like cupin family protein
MSVQVFSPLVDALASAAPNPDLTRLVTPPREGRTFHLLGESSELQLWLIAWAPGATTGWHDHGTAASAYTVVRGSLRDRRWEGSRLRGLRVGKGDVLLGGAGGIHDVRNGSPEPAWSLHAYGPRLDAQHLYDLEGSQLVLRAADPGRTSVPAFRAG